MSRRDIIRSDLQTSLQQRFPLHIAVARDTRIGGSSVQIFIYKIINYIFLKFLPEVHHIISYSEAFRHTSCVFHRRQSAASSIFFQCTDIIFLPYLHRNADNLISLFLQKICRHGRIHSTGHSNYYFFCHCCLPVSI